MNFNNTNLFNQQPQNNTINLPINTSADNPNPLASNTINNPINNISSSNPINIDSNPNINSNISTFPINLRNKSILEILDSINTTLTTDLKTFISQAQTLYSLDTKILRTRNNYINITNLIKKETETLTELETSIDYLENFLNQNNVNKISNKSEIEKSLDTFNNKCESLKDEGREVMVMLEENYSLMEEIDELIEAKKGNLSV